jgi:5-methylcytosine-specific restriction endonuclease McrA
MKICSKCKQEKSESEFFVKDRKTGRLHAQCKACYQEHRKTYYSEHYKKYHDEYLLRARKRRLEVKSILHGNLQAFLSDKKCIMCGENDPVVLDFDHINPATKSFSIAKAITYGKKWEEIFAEIQKCQILCANCHRRKTAKEGNWHGLSKK